MSRPFLDNGHPVAQGLEFAQDVGGDDDGFAQPLKLLQDGHHLDARPGVQPAGRLVQQQQLRVVDQHPRQAEPLLHAPAQRADERPFLLRQPHQFQHVVHRLLPLRRRNLVAGAKEIQVLRHLHVLIHAEEVRHVTNHVAHRIGLAQQVASENLRRAGRRAPGTLPGCAAWSSCPRRSSR